MERSENVEELYLQLSYDDHNEDFTYVKNGRKFLDGTRETGIGSRLRESRVLWFETSVVDTICRRRSRNASVMGYLPCLHSILSRRLRSIAGSKELTDIQMLYASLSANARRHLRMVDSSSGEGFGE